MYGNRYHCILLVLYICHVTVKLVIIFDREIKWFVTLIQLKHNNPEIIILYYSLVHIENQNKIYSFCHIIFVHISIFSIDK